MKNFKKLNKQQFNNELYENITDYNNEFIDTDDKYNIKENKVKTFRKTDKYKKIKQFLFDKSRIKNNSQITNDADEYWNNPQLSDLTPMVGKDETLMSYGYANFYKFNFDNEFEKEILKRKNLTIKELINKLFNKYYLKNGFSYLYDPFENILYFHTFNVYYEEIVNFFMIK